MAVSGKRDSWRERLFTSHFEPVSALLHVLSLCLYFYCLMSTEVLLAKMWDYEPFLFSFLRFHI